MRARHAPSNRSLPLVLGALLALVAVGAGACFSRGGEERPPAPEEPPVPEFSFSVSKVSAVTVDDEPAEAALDRAAEDVAGVLDGLYTTAFVDPEAWAGGTFPSLPEHFSGPAARQARRDLDDLSLGEAAAQVERVEPTRGRLRVSFLVDDAKQPFAAVAEATFRATGTTTDGRPLTIEHAGTYFLRAVDGAWAIVGYEVEGNVQTAPGGAATGGGASP